MGQLSLILCNILCALARISKNQSEENLKNHIMITLTLNGTSVTKSREHFFM